MEQLLQRALTVLTSVRSSTRSSCFDCRCPVTILMPASFRRSTMSAFLLWLSSLTRAVTLWPRLADSTAILLPR